MKNQTNPSMYDGDRPCDKCGGPTLRVGQGSIWCPDEDAHKGGHFVVRVAFAQPPRRTADGGWDRGTLPPKRQPKVAAPRASVPTTKPVIVKPVDDGFDQGMDGFVRSEEA